MAQNTFPASVPDSNQLSAEEFQRKLYNWFEDRGLLSDLRAHLRRQMIIALRDTSLSTHTANSIRQTGSPKLQAINLLIAEFLLQQEYHYTLSVFTSEVPLLRNLPEFSTSVNNAVIRTTRSANETFPRFQQRDVWDILEAVGLSSNSEQGLEVYELYQNSQGESLFTCIIRALPRTTPSKSKSEVDDGNLLKSNQPPSRKTSPTVELSSAKNEQELTIAQSDLFTPEMKDILLQSSLKSHHITQLHEALRRLVEGEMAQVRREEEGRFQQELVDRERRIQAELTRHENDIHRKLSAAEQQMVNQRQALDEHYTSKQRQMSELAAKLRQQETDVMRRLRQAEDRSRSLKKREKQLAELKDQEGVRLETKSSELEVKQQQLDQEMQRLSEERETGDKVKRELEDSRQKLIDASRALQESRSEVAFLRELQSKCTHLHYAQELTRNQRELPTPSIQTQTQTETQEEPFVSRGIDQCTGTQMEQQTQTDVRQLQEQIEEEQELQQTQQVLVDDFFQQLQQENSELRGHTQQQRLRINELTTHAAQLANQLEDAQTAIALLSNRQPEFVYLPPGAGTITVPPLFAPGQVAPPPPPPPLVQDRIIGGFASRQLGAGEELGRMAHQMHTSSAGPPRPPRDWRKKPPRRLVVHGTTSSDESSPTEEILQEARRRLRRLEEESAAVDRSYRDFRLRHSESLAATASVLFNPVGPREDLAFRFPVQQSGNPPSFAFRSDYIRNRAAFSQRPNTIYEQMLTRNPNNIPLMHTGRLPTFPLFTFSQANEQNPFAFGSGQTMASGTVLNPSPQISTGNQFSDIASNVSSAEILYTNTFATTTSDVWSRERHPYLSTPLNHATASGTFNSIRQQQMAPVINHSHNPESVVAVTSRLPLMSTTVYNTPQVSYLVENSSINSVEERDPIQQIGRSSPIQPATQVSRWAAIQQEAEYMRMSQPLSARSPPVQSELILESGPSCHLPPLPSAENNSLRPRASVFNAITTSPIDGKVLTTILPSQPNISTIGTIESLNDSTSPTSAHLNNNNLSSNTNEKLPSTGTISKSTSTATERITKSHGSFSRANVTSLPSTSEVTAVRKSETPTLVSGGDTIQDGKGIPTVPENNTLLDKESQNTHVPETPNCQEESSRIGPEHKPDTKETDGGNKQDIAVTDENTTGSTFLELRDGDQFVNTSVCQSEFSGIATSSAPTQNISFSTSEISSDRVISAGEDSNKSDKDEFW